MCLESEYVKAIRVLYLYPWFLATSAVAKDNNCGAKRSYHS